MGGPHTTAGLPDPRLQLLSDRTRYVSDAPAAVDPGRPAGPGVLAPCAGPIAPVAAAGDLSCVLLRRMGDAHVGVLPHPSQELAVGRATRRTGVHRRPRGSRP